MEEENTNKIIVDFGPGTKREEKEEEEPPPPPETQIKRTRSSKPKVRLEGEPITVNMDGSPSEVPIKPKRAPPKRKQPAEQEIKETPKEDIEEIKEPEQTKKKI